MLPVKSPTAQSVVRRLKAPSAEHVLGTDRLGRDILSRVVWGTRVSLAVGAAVVAISALTGTVVGLTSGYFRGPASDLLVRGVDVLQTFPALILALAIVTALGPGLGTVIAGISLGYVPAVRPRHPPPRPRRARAGVRRGRAGRGGEHRAHPAPPRAAERRRPGHRPLHALVPAAILTESSLSFLGLGITEPTPTWGNMIDTGRLVLREAPWLTIFPSAALVLTVIAFNLVGDAIRDALDPHVQEMWVGAASRARHAALLG
jgi:peptide/nickel transport system permease protein